MKFLPGNLLSFLSSMLHRRVESEVRCVFLNILKRSFRIRFFTAKTKNEEGNHCYIEWSPYQWLNNDVPLYIVIKTVVNEVDGKGRSTTKNARLFFCPESIKKYFLGLLHWLIMTKKEKTLNSACYFYFLNCLKTAIKRSDLLSERVFLNQHNTRPHYARLRQEKLKIFRW